MSGFFFTRYFSSFKQVKFLTFSMNMICIGTFRTNHLQIRQTH